MFIEQLKQKFGGCKFQQRCRCANKTPYETSYENAIYVYDPPTEENQPVRFVKETDRYQLTIENPLGQSVLIVKTDKCLFDDTTKKCDCILANHEQVYFVEIKDTKLKRRNAARAEAISQLEITLQQFADNQINDPKCSTFAVICFRTLHPNIIKPSELKRKATFFEKYGAKLIEGSHIVFGVLE
jgi:hypothetical protein